MALEYKFHGFATHSWVRDEEGRNTHMRVVYVCEQLKKNHNVLLWIDEERMTGHIQEAMCEGIDQSATFVLFLTKAYVEKVAQKENPLDNCKCEFNYGMRKRRPKTILVMMEKAVKNKENLTGPVEMVSVSAFEAAEESKKVMCFLCPFFAMSVVLISFHLSKLEGAVPQAIFWGAIPDQRAQRVHQHCSDNIRYC